MFLVSYQREHGDDSVENLFDLIDVDVVLEASLANADDFMQVILDTLVRPFGRDLSTKTLEEATQFFGLEKRKKDVAVLLYY
jgi:hypothetical protein